MGKRSCKCEINIKRMDTKKARLYSLANQPSTTNRFYNPKNYETIVMNNVFSYCYATKKVTKGVLVCNKSHTRPEKSIKFREISILPSFSSFLSKREITSRDEFNFRASI